tara:strand:+ start:14822 stop:17101 length:2280 start_codon:yes stop_codon:yes gene_type:complete
MANESLERQLEALKAERERLKVQEDIVKRAEEELTLLEKKEILAGKLSKKEKKRYEDAKFALDLARERVALAEKETPNIKEQGEQLEKQLSLLKEIEGKTQSILKITTGITETTFSDTFIGKIWEAKKAFGNLEEVQKQVATTVHKTFKPMNVLTGQLKKVALSSLWLAREQENAIAAFRLSSGGAKDLSESIVDLELTHRQIGVTAMEISKVFTSLRATMVQFEKQDRATQDSLAMTAVAMEKFGGSAQASAKILNEMMLVHGKTAEEANNLQLESLATAKAIGMPYDMMQESLSTVLPTLAKFGSGAERIFKETAAASRALGVSMERLVNIAEQFQTFEGAATSAGKLNAILGGPFYDDLELLNASFQGTTEVLRVVRKGFDDSGKSLKNMTAAEKIFIAKSVNFSDVSEMTKVLTGDLEEYIKKAEAGIIEQEQLNKEMDKAQTVMQKLANIGKAFAVSMRLPIAAVHWFAKLLVNNKSAMWSFIVVVGFLTTAMILAGIATKAAAVKAALAEFGILKSAAAREVETAALVLHTKALKKNTKALKRNAAAKTTVGSAAGASVVNMLAFGLAALLIGGAVFLAATGLSNLVSSFKGIGDAAGPAILSMVLVLAAVAALVWGLTAMAPLTTAAVLSMMALGGAMALVGASIMMMGKGLSMVINSFAGLGALNTETSLMEFRKTIEAVVSLEASDNIENTKGVVDQILKLKNQNPVVNVTQEPQEMRPLEITINLDGKDIYKKLHREINEKLNIQTYAR